MSNIVNTIKDKVTGKHHDKPSQQPHQNEDEQTFSIQPHPAMTNDPRDLQPSLGGGLNTNPEVGAFHARDPHVPSPQVANNLPPPQSREELRARAAELNKD